jgi:hypothetical protein
MGQVSDTYPRVTLNVDFAFVEIAVAKSQKRWQRSA